MKVLMVCLGNICRSPLAEGILKHKFGQHGIQGEVDSAGTAAYHAGEKPDSRSIDIARKNGIDISKQRARKFETADFDRFDRIYAMDRSNYANLMEQARTPADENKIQLILDLIHPGSHLEVPDPYYGGRDGFSHVFHLLDKACNRMVEDLNQEKHRDS